MMDKVKLAVVYYSSYGTNYEMARTAAEAAEEAGAEVRLRKVRETAPRQVVQGQEGWAAHARATADVPVARPEDLDWADAYLFSSPTRYGGAASQMRSFIDTLGPLWMEGKLANKVVSAMTSAMNPHGGQETTLQSLYFTFMHWGAIIVTPGYVDDVVSAAGGNPYGASVTATDGSVGEEDRAAIRFQAQRVVEMAERFAGTGAGVV
jgi:NAD(P)H dehydrogenase (quinone)